MRLVLAALTVTATGLCAVPSLLPWGIAQAQLSTPAATSVSYFRADGAWRAALFVCDGTNRDRAYAMSPPGQNGRVTLQSYARPGLASAAATLVLGAGDAGMSQVRYPLSRPGGEATGWVHTISPGIVAPGATTPTVTSVKLGDDITHCRFAPQTRVLGVTAARSIQVTATERNGYRYRSYNHDTRLAEITQPWGGRDTRASLTIEGGRLVDDNDGRRIYEFASGGYLYRVLAGAEQGRVGGGVQVLQNGRLVLQEPFGAYTAALRP